jgi:hypothetical protein
MNKDEFENLSDQQKLLHAVAVIVAVANNADPIGSFSIEDNKGIPLHTRLFHIEDKLSLALSSIEKFMSKELEGDFILEQNILFLNQFQDDLKALRCLTNSIRDNGINGVTNSHLSTLELVLFRFTSTYDINVASMSDKLVLMRRNGNTNTIIRHVPILDPILVVVHVLYLITLEYKNKGQS